MKVRWLLLFFVILLIIGCGKKSEENIDVLDKTQDVLEDIEFAKKSTAENAAYNLRKSIELYYMNILLESSVEIDVIEFSCSIDGCISNNGTLDLSGLSPTSGEIILNIDGSATYKNIIINGYNCNIPNNGEISCSK